MSGVKHTPGPWFEQVGFSDDVEITAESREGMVAICAMDLGFTGHIGVEQEANARLIAAAPDLLEACVEAAKTFRRYESLHLDKGTVDGAQKAAANASQAKSIEAIIARARGEQDGGGE